MKVKWPKGTPDRACVEASIRFRQMAREIRKLVLLWQKTGS